MSDTGAARFYRWSDILQDHPMEQIDRRRIFGEKVLLAEIVVREGCHVPTHHHENEQFVCVLSGALRLGIGAEDDPERREVVVREGEVLHLPSDVPHSAVAIEDTRVLDVFSPPSQETGVDRVHRG